MTYKPETAHDIYKKKEEEFDPDFCVLSYGPKTRLAVERDEGRWSWTELDQYFKTKTVQYSRFDSFMDAIKNYETTTYHDVMEIR